MNIEANEIEQLKALHRNSPIRSKLLAYAHSLAIIEDAERTAAKAARLDITDVCMCSGTDHSWCVLHSAGQPLSVYAAYNSLRLTFTRR